MNTFIPSTLIPDSTVVSPCIIPIYKNNELINVNNSTSSLLYELMCNHCDKYAIYTGVMNDNYRIVIEVSKRYRNNYTYVDDRGYYYYVYYVPSLTILCDQIITKHSIVFTTNKRLIIDHVHHPIQMIPGYILEANSDQLPVFCKDLISDLVTATRKFDLNYDDTNLNSLGSLMFEDEGDYITRGIVKFHKVNNKQIICNILRKLDVLIQKTYAIM